MSSHLLAGLNEERLIIPQPQATLEVIGSKWSYTLKLCLLNMMMMNNDDDDYDGFI